MRVIDPGSRRYINEELGAPSGEKENSRKADAGEQRPK